MIGAAVANKKQVPGSTQAKARAMREAQAASDRRTRNIIIGVVVAVVVAIVAALIWVVVSQSKAQQAAAQQSMSEAGVPAPFAQGEPINISSAGVAPGSVKPTDDDLVFFFDYTCPGCVYTDSLVGGDLAAAAEAGDFTLSLRPVMTHNLPFNGAATAASLQVAAKDPDHFVALHQAMNEYYLGVMNAGDDSEVSDLAKAQVKVAELAAEVGVPQDVIDSFSTDAAEAYLTASSQQWRDAEVKGRDGGLSSPEFAFRGTQLTPEGQTGPEMFQSITQQMADLGWSGGAASQSDAAQSE